MVVVQVPNVFPVEVGVGNVDMLPNTVPIWVLGSFLDLVEGTVVSGTVH